MKPTPILMMDGKCYKPGEPGYEEAIAESERRRTAMNENDRNKEAARKLVADWRAMPDPKAGTLDRDSMLVNLLASKFGEMRQEKTNVIAREVSTSGELSEAINRADALTVKKIHVENKLFALAEEMEGRTFGSGIATEKDLYEIAAKIRQIVRTT